MTTTPRERDWTVDFGDENGDYQNQCAECKELFLGHKRRCVCRACFNRINSTPHAGKQMTPKEIVERVRERNQKRQIIVDHNPDDIDHLLAIHAAVVEMFEAKDAFATALFNETCSEDERNACEARLEKAYANLAALCGWEAEGA